MILPEPPVDFVFRSDQEIGYVFEAAPIVHKFVRMSSGVESLDAALISAIDTLTIAEMDATEI